MATIPDDEAPQPTAERIARAVIAPVQHNRLQAFLAVAAGAGSLAPDPFGVLVAAALVAAAWDIGKRR